MNKENHEFSKIELIRYYDHSHSENQSIDEVNKFEILILEDVGFLVREDDLSITLAHCRGSNNLFDTSNIIKSCIIERKELK